MSVRLCMAGLGLVALLTSCATTRPSGTDRASTGSGAYSEDLSSVRPVYGSIGNTRPANTPPPSTSAATTSTTPVATAPRKAEPRRPTAPTAASMSVNRQLDVVLDSLATQNRSIRYAPGFRIQVYVGTQRQEVDALRQSITQSYPELSPYLSYNQPTYTLKIGDFMRRVDAERYFASIKQQIRSAQLQGDKIDVRRALLIK